MLDVQVNFDSLELRITIYSNTTISDIRTNKKTLRRVLEERRDRVAEEGGPAFHVVVQMVKVPPVHVVMNGVAQLLKLRPLLDVAVEKTTLRVPKRHANFIRSLASMHKTEAVTVESL